MTDMKAYRFGPVKELVKKRPDEVEHIIQQVERRHRTGSGEFAYSPLGLSTDQTDSIKETWPVDAVQILGKVAKSLGKIESNDPHAQDRRRYDILHSALTQEFKHEEDPTGKLAATALAFAMLRGVAPDFPVSGTIKAGGKTFALKPVPRPERLVVDCNKVDAADAYIFALYDANMRRAWLLGWATSGDMRSCEHGNRITKPKVCRWREEAYFRPLDKLRPMADLMRKMGVTKVREGIVFESVPDASDLPVIPSGPDIDKLLDNSLTEAHDNFYASIGLDDLDDVSSKSQEPRSETQEAAPTDELAF